jgi:murein DD-endopeptidase MepM/ murein hydrolase activator NlpD
MRKVLTTAFTLAFIISLCLPVGAVKAQGTPPTGPIYIVQPGDTLWDISIRFGVSIDDLANANGITNTSLLNSGQQLIIPGLEGIQGILTTQIVPFGETLHSLSLRYQVPVNMLMRLNHITSPHELYAGYSLVIPQNDNPGFIGKRTTLATGQSMLELAILNGSDPWSMMAGNELDSSWSVLPGEVLRAPGNDDAGPGALPPALSSADLSSLIQGQTAEVRLTGVGGLSFSGSLMDHALNFFAYTDNSYIALQGIYAMAQPGLYPLVLQGTLPDGTAFGFSQMVLVSAGEFLYDVPLYVDPATLDPENTGPENELWSNFSTPVSPEKLWAGIFSIPVDPIFADCWSSRFGSRRSYNNSDYIYYHSGLDFCGQVGDPIYAAAAGVVVFTGLLTVRGNATMIDHGWGVYTAYMHQSEILVQAGDWVEQGQLIGRVGNTGRVEGPHLHFEVLVGGVPVDPLVWLSQEYP